MKIVWTIVALLLLGGIIVLLQPPPNDRPDALSAPDIARRATPTEPMSATGTEPKPESKPEPKPQPKPRPAPKGEMSAVPSAATPGLSGFKLTSAPKTADGQPRRPSEEPPKPTADALASGSEFKPEIPAIEQAELLPSKFIKLADGTISVDDAWTIRGDGTEASPYEVSWEFLSSAQEEYIPRLGDKKLPARIAFLSGKRVKIAGYLAFPLVAPTASECLLMLNQWDGCCIGVPPTPYDAVEVRLATEMKGWKRHTINFGTIEGTFKVEPYLVENWLVGLYLFENATLNTEL